MCLSAEVDFGMGLAISAVGVASLTRVRQRREILLAALPLAFGLHQIAEGFVWLGLEGRVSASVGTFALHAYVLYAWALLPVLAPLAVIGIERDPRHRRWMGSFLALGTVVALSLVWPVLHDRVTATIVEHTIRYHGAGSLGGLLTLAYVVATCGALLASSDRRLVAAGVVNVIAVAAIVWLQAQALTSVWCVWAAVLSVGVWWYLGDRHGQRAEALTPA
jgi:hypothetical protein